MTNYPVTLKPYVGPDAYPVPDKSGGKLIAQVARTNCAGAIWRIHDAINRYTEHTCRTITASSVTNGRRFPHDVLLGQAHEVKHLLAKADVVHFHNWIDYESPEMVNFQHELKGKRKVLQYHTEPSLLQRQFKRDVINREDITTLAIAQKHARFYPKSIIVPNMVDIWDKRLMPIKRDSKGPLRVIYTPSDLKAYAVYATTCCGKGYPQVMPVLKKLKAEGIIDFTVVTDKTWEELMPIKQQHDVCIDECVTGGYHLCSLEALAQGLATIAWIDGQTKAAISRVVGQDTELPWINTQQHHLEETLRGLAKDRGFLAEKQKESREWMEQHWNPAILVRHFVDAYWSKPIDSEIVCHPKQIHRRWGVNNHLQSTYKVPGTIRDDARRLAGAWSDRRVIVWGNGPSVTEAMGLKDQPWFQQAVHIGTNAAAKLPIKFDAYCIGDKRFLEVPEKKEIALTAPGVRIYQSILRPYLPQDLPISYIETIGRDGFCSDLVAGCYHGYSVAYFALQVAVWSGCRDILLAGCGHNYDPKQPRFYKEVKASQIDDSFPRILNNYRQIIPILESQGIQVRTIGKSRLADAGVRQFLT